MKWDKAIKLIRWALDHNCSAEVWYHTKRQQDFRTDTVERLTEYDYKGKKFVAVSTYHDLVDKGLHTIDYVKVTLF